MAHQQVRTSQPLLRHLISATAVAAVLVIDLPLPARAEPRDPIPPTPHNWGYAYGARQPGRSETAPAGERRTSGSAVSGGGKSSGPEDTPMCGVWRMGVRGCSALPIPTDPGSTPPAPTVSPAQVAAQAWQRLRLPTPQVSTAPPRGSNGLVGLTEWFWVTNWTSHSNRVQVGGVWAAVTARPTSLSIDTGTGRPSVECPGPGTAYDRARPANTQRSNCSYTYVRSSVGLPGSAFQVTATVTWSGTWVGSGGAGGTLPALARSTSFPLRVAEGQAVTGG
jgi:hypothetical protein